MEGEEQVLDTTPAAEVDAGEVVDAGKTAEEQALKELDGHDVDITNNGEKEDTKTEEEGEKKESEDKKEDKPKDSVEAVEQNVKEQMKAQEDVKADLASKGVDYDALEQEYAENGELSPESMKALEGAGYPKSVVNAFIKGFEATVKEFSNAVYDAAGGEEEYAKICQFIRSCGDKEVKAFNETIESGSVSQVTALIEGYKARMTTKYGTNNRSILGGAGSVSKGGFNSKDAMVKAMNDPRYGTDMAYTEKVQRMTMQSTFMG